MKKVLLLTLIVAATSSSFAQGKGHDKNKSKKEDAFVSAGKSSKHQPKKVEEALLRDYPQARNVVWSKYKGDYTATFNNGPWRSTAVYHANGDRRDTRTYLTRQQLPGTNWDNIFKRDNVAPVSYIQIERPSITEKIFRVLSGNKSVVYYDQNGNKVQYDY